ncbi:hypothetical protein [Ciceribacter lividus]|uniref:hypothetical protein n=1 Tax=Ciceribacter lividus TaxID=1197950 RepID=UPI0011C06509|nr:hypothetical protein [Ciceribacter lividus]
MPSTQFGSPRSRMRDVREAQHYHMAAAVVAASLSSVWPHLGQRTGPPAGTVAGEMDTGR